MLFRSLKEYLTNKFTLNDEDIYIKGNLAHIDYFYSNEDKLIDIAEEFFDNKKELVLSELEEQDNKGGFNVFLYGIPIFLRAKVSFKFKFKEFIDKYLNRYMDEVLIIEELEEILNLESLYVSSDRLYLAEELEDFYMEFAKMISAISG